MTRCYGVDECHNSKLHDFNEKVEIPHGDKSRGTGKIQFA